MKICYTDENDVKNMYFGNKEGTSKYLTMYNLDVFCLRYKPGISFSFGLQVIFDLPSIQVIHCLHVVQVDPRDPRE